MSDVDGGGVQGVPLVPYVGCPDTNSVDDSPSNNNPLPATPGFCRLWGCSAEGECDQRRPGGMRHQ